MIRSIHKTQEEKPCSDVADAIIDFTGGQIDQDLWSDIKSNYDQTMGFDVASVAGYGIGVDTPIAVGTAPYVAGTWGGVTPGQAITQTVAATRAAVKIPGLIGFRTPLQLVGTTAVSWAWNAVVAKGAYRVGVAAGSVLRAGVNRAATSTCKK